MNIKSLSQSLCALGLIIVSQSHAQEEPTPVVIKSVNESRSKVLVESDSTEKFKVGDLLNVGKNCLLEVTQTTATQVVLNAELCREKQILKKDSTIHLQASPKSDLRVSINKAFNSPSRQASKGIRVEFVKSFLDGNLKIHDEIILSGEADHNFSLGVGYADIRVNQPGFTTRLIYTQFNSLSSSIRIDGNGTYGLNNNIYLLGGLNLHNFTSGPTQLDTGLGFQIGAGVQFTENFGAGLSFVSINNSAQIDGSNVDFTAKGLELSLHATF